MTFSMVLWVGVDTPTVYTQRQEPNRTLLLQNLKNGNINGDMKGLIIVLSDSLDDPNVNESVLKDCEPSTLLLWGM